MATRIHVFVLLIALTCSSAGFAVVVFNDGETHDIDYEIADHVWVDGAGTRLNILPNGHIVHGLEARGDSQIDIAGGLLDSLNLYGHSRAYLSEGAIANHLQAGEYTSVTITGGSVAQVIGVQQHAHVFLGGGSVEYLHADDDGQIEVTGGLIADRAQLYDNSVIIFTGSDFNYAYGEIPDAFGVLTGTLANGDPLLIRFEKHHDARMLLVPKMDWVKVGDPGNHADDTGHGEVDYIYWIGKYEVTNGQYCEFLNAVATIQDTHQLYNGKMDTSPYGGITRSGDSGKYSYTVKEGWTTRPVNFVSWYDCLRFANWLHNGQPIGPQDETTTENGAYSMTGTYSRPCRNENAIVWLPSENEWYKAAFYKGGSADAGYWEYATQSDTPPVADAPPGGANSANWLYQLGSPYIAATGSYELAISAYGTCDQNGNVGEWNESRQGSYDDHQGGCRGGSWQTTIPAGLSASGGRWSPAAEESATKGFRLARRPRPRVLFVDASATGTGDGTSWEKALACLQDALMFAGSGGEIRVAEGVYRPHEFTWTPRPNLGRAETFRLRNGVAMYGGFPSGGGDWEDRNPNMYPTILSGDLAGDDQVPADIAKLRTEATRAENAYHVVTAIGVDETAVLDGFVITGGNANAAEAPHYRGGGVYVEHGSPTIKHCRFIANTATYGGGLYNYSQGSPVVRDCEFTGNAGYVGGALTDYGTAQVSMCTLMGNRAMNGGAFYGRSPTFSNCIVAANKATGSGGGLWTNASPVITLCTIADNTATTGGGLYATTTGKPTLVNSLLWGNSAGGSLDKTAQIAGGAPVIYYSTVQGWHGSDPLFADPDNGDYHLQSAAGRWDPGAGDWVIDDVTSPAIDAGSPFADVGDEPEPHGGRINQGAYGGTAEASKSLGPFNIADLNRDGVVDIRDHAIMAENWLRGLATE